MFDFVRFFAIVGVLAGVSCQRAGDSTLAGESLPAMVSRVKHAVVNVDVVGQRNEGGQVAGTGSGFFIDDKGHVLTNQHVIDDATAVRVRLDDGTRLEAEVVGADPLADVALLRVLRLPEKLQYVELADSNALKVGEPVVAIGNPFGLASSVSSGIVSAVAREELRGPYDEYLQTDAAINPGNSGGPLFNLEGKVVGMNAATVKGGAGIGFAIPSTLLKRLLPQLMEKGVVERGWLGLELDEVTPDLALALGLEGKSGVLVISMADRGPAEKAGLRSEDVITRLESKVIDSPGMLSRALGFSRPNTTLKLEVYRDGKPLEISVTVGKRPDFERFAEKNLLPKKKGNGSGKPSIGLSLQTLRGGEAGVLITNVVPNSAADVARLKEGDTILEINRQPMYSAQEVANELTQSAPDTVCLIRIRRAGGGETLRAVRTPQKKSNDEA